MQNDNSKCKKNIKLGRYFSFFTFRFSLNRGFTLVEMIVAVGVFIVVMVSGIGALMSMIDANRKAQSLRTVMDNLNFTLENITRTMRVGVDYHCGTLGDLNSPRDCALEGDSFIAFKDSDGTLLIFRLNNRRIERSVDGGATFLGITAPEIEIQELKFFVRGSTDTDEIQPKVLVIVKGRAGVTERINTTFNLQTTASQRLLDVSSLLPPPPPPPPPPLPPPPYTTAAVAFDGNTDHLRRDAASPGATDLTGNVDGKKGTISFWVKFDAEDGLGQYIHYSGGGYLTIIRLENNGFEIRLHDASVGAVILKLNSAKAYTASTGWHHVIASWDLSVPVAHLWIDGVNDEHTVVTIKTNDTIDYTRVNHFVASYGTAGESPIELADVYHNYVEYLDLSVAANLQKFRTAGGKPANLGADGSTPTGTKPIIFLRRAPGSAAGTFADNLGSGGNFTITGALTESATSPSD